VGGAGAGGLRPAPGNGSLTEEVETAATDLLSDLRHLFDALGVDWEAAVSSSDDHYRGEIFGQL
jgi:hypothetical protein